MNDFSYCPTGEFSRRQVRPVPYYTVPGTVFERRLAASLRATFVLHVKRRLAGHHLCGQRHDWVVRFVERHKSRYPYFLTGDIRLFFATVRHEDVVTYLQSPTATCAAWSTFRVASRSASWASSPRGCGSFPCSGAFPWGAP